MASWPLKGPEEAHYAHHGPPSSSDEAEKIPYNYDAYQEGPPAAGELSDPNDVHHSLHRGLSARQVSMIAIGGAIGTGLIIGTGSALATAGPASLMISYTIVGMIVYVVMAALGEMATWLPAPGGFAIYATRYVDPGKF